MDEESFRLVAESKGLGDLLKASDAKATSLESEAEYDPKSEIEKLKAAQVERDSQAQEAQSQAELAEAEATYGDRMLEIVSESDEYKALAHKSLQREVFAEAWQAISDSNYDMSVEDATAAGIERATAMQTAIIEAHQASKEAGPGAPGEAAGEMARRKEFGNEGDRQAHIQAYAKHLAAGGKPM